MIFLIGFLAMIFAAFSDGSDYGMRWMIGIFGALICLSQVKNMRRRQKDF